MSYQIVIIEDDEDIIDIYEAAFDLAEINIECKMFMDAESGLGYLRNHRADLIISDINLPNMNGVEMVRRIRKDSANQNSLIFMVSGYVHDEARELAEAMRDIVIFEKPIEHMAGFVDECMAQLSTRRTLSYDEQLIDIVRNSSYHLLSSYFQKQPIVGRSQLNPLNASPDSLRAYIPFESPSFQGSLAVDLGEGFIDLFNKSIETSEALSRHDIAYEMANQLAGQFKSTVAKEGYRVTIGVPVITTLKEVGELRPKEDPVVYIPAGFMGALFRIEFTMSTSDLSQVAQNQNADELASGEMVLFD